MVFRINITALPSPKRLLLKDLVLLSSAHLNALDNSSSEGPVVKLLPIDTMGCQMIKSLLTIQRLLK